MVKMRPKPIRCYFLKTIIPYIIPYRICIEYVQYGNKPPVSKTHPKVSMQIPSLKIMGGMYSLKNAKDCPHKGLSPQK